MPHRQDHVMSFAKAQDLVRLARLAAARRSGICLDEICEEFDVSHRTAQRMTDALETVFTNVAAEDGPDRRRRRSEEHTSELQSLMRISYAVFCLKKKKINTVTVQH